MSRYTELIEKLDAVLTARRALCGPRDIYGMLPKEENQDEWNRLTKEAEEIRHQMRVFRYGKGTD